MKKVLVTGGSGFIGTNLISKLIEEKYDVLSIDLNEPKLAAHYNFFKKVDLLDFVLLKEVIKSFDPECVIHLAARTDLNGSILQDYDVNVNGVKNLLTILKEIPSLNRVVFASSMYVCEPGYIPLNDDDYKPHTIYGESKVLTEKIIKDNDPKYIWSIVRPTSIWGPYFGEPYNLFFKIVLSRKYLHMGNKACKKTYGYIDNFIYQVFCILNAKAKLVNKNIFYLGDYEAYDISEWADEIASEKSIKIHNVPYNLFKLLAYTGDALKYINIKFPMTSFRLKNMTTNNIFDLSKINMIAPNLPVSRKDGTTITVNWMGH